MKQYRYFSSVNQNGEILFFSRDLRFPRYYRTWKKAKKSKSTELRPFFLKEFWTPYLKVATSPAHAETLPPDAPGRSPAPNEA